VQRTTIVVENGFSGRPKVQRTAIVDLPAKIKQVDL